MNRYKAADIYMARTPMLSIEKFEEIFSDKNSKENVIENIDKLLDNKFFLEALSVASPTLFESVKEKQFNDNKKKEKIYNSLAKYIIRSTSRTTPFGLFTGISIGKFSDKSSIKLNKSSFHKKRARVDMEWLYKLIYTIEKNEDMREKLKVRFNNTCIVKGDRLDNILVDGELYDNSLNSISSVKYTNQVINVMNLTKEFVTYNNLKLEMEKINPNVEKEKICGFIDTLFKNEFIISELRPPLINADPFKYILSILSENDKCKELYRQLIEIDNLIEIYNNIKLGNGIELYNEICTLMGKIYKSKYYLQIDFKINTIEDSLSNDIKAEMEKVTNAILNFCIDNESINPLTLYKKEFLDKYGYDMEVNVLELVDNTIGIGYPEDSLDTNGYKLTKKQRYLKNLILDKNSKCLIERKYEIVLNDSDFKEFNEKNNLILNKDINSPKTFEINYIINKLPYKFEKENFILTIGPNVGSNSVGRSFGRFADILNDDFQEDLNRLNNDKKNIYDNNTIIAEIFEPTKLNRWANVALNYNNYDYQIPIATRECNNKKIISLEDIYIGIDRVTNRLYIKSKRLDKYVICDVSNMLNLNVCSQLKKLLVNISQNQDYNIATFIENLDMRELIYTPRIKYSNTILRPSSWKLSRKILGLTNSKFSFNEFNQKLNEWRKSWKIPAKVYLSRLDNRLLLNLENSFNLEQVYLLVKNSDQVYVFFEFEGNLSDSYAKNYYGKPLALEVVVPFYSNIKDSKPINNYDTHSGELKTKSRYKYNCSKLSVKNEKRILPPGKEGWIYMLLYNNTSRTQELISDNIIPFANDMIKKCLIEKYFFIKYVDKYKHIRLRMKMNENINYMDFFGELSEFYNYILKRKLIKKVSIDTYEREIERYGGIELIDIAEEYFYYDSNYIGQALGNNRLNEDYFTLSTIKLMLDTIGLPLEEQYEFCSHINPSSKQRDNFRKHRKILMDKIGNDEKCLKEIICGASNDYDVSMKNAYYLREKSLLRYWENICIEDENNNLTNSKKNIITSLIHMFCNRIKCDNLWEYEIMCLFKFTINDLIQYKKYSKRNSNNYER
ncbi:MAG: lantibiotic dehydratase [Romboutsia sp.]